MWDRGFKSFCIVVAMAGCEVGNANRESTQGQQEGVGWQPAHAVASHEGNISELAADADGDVLDVAWVASGEVWLKQRVNNVWLDAQSVGRADSRAEIYEGTDNDAHQSKTEFEVDNLVLQKVGERTLIAWSETIRPEGGTDETRIHQVTVRGDEVETKLLTLPDVSRVVSFQLVTGGLHTLLGFKYNGKMVVLKYDILNGWGEPQLIFENSDEYRYGNLQLAIDPSGSGFAVLVGTAISTSTYLNELVGFYTTADKTAWSALRTPAIHTTHGEILDGAGLEDQSRGPVNENGVAVAADATGCRIVWLQGAIDGAASDNRYVRTTRCDVDGQCGKQLDVWDGPVYGTQNVAMSVQHDGKAVIAIDDASKYASARVYSPETGFSTPVSIYGTSPQVIWDEHRRAMLISRYQEPAILENNGTSVSLLSAVWQDEAWHVDISQPPYEVLGTAVETLKPPLTDAPSFVLPGTTSASFSTVYAISGSGVWVSEYIGGAP